jgi:8-amino-7-oxononanoate synthase
MQSNTDKHLFLFNRLIKRKNEGTLRQLQPQVNNKIDFYSNNYLGFANHPVIYQQAHELILNQSLKNGSTGSRLISGNYSLIEETEQLIAQTHNAEAALLFNSGYDANVGFWSCVPQRGDVILYDELVHASIRDGIRLSLAQSYSFKHNDSNDLQKKISRCTGRIFIAVESIYSMDGDEVNEQIIQLGQQSFIYLVVDEAHAVGVVGPDFRGGCQNFTENVFARIITFGKAIGCHGAAVVGSNILRDYLLNFSRSFIYTTALPPHSVAVIYSAYQYFKANTVESEKLKNLITYFNNQCVNACLDKYFVALNNSAIKAMVIGNNVKVSEIEKEVCKHTFLVKAIYSPTVPKGTERIRICLHAYNTQQQIDELISLLSNFL